VGLQAYQPASTSASWQTGKITVVQYLPCSHILGPGKKPGIVKRIQKQIAKFDLINHALQCDNCQMIVKY